MLKWSINPITNLNIVDIHTLTWQYKMTVRTIFNGNIYRKGGRKIEHTNKTEEM
jgi:hypothetical protein